MAKKTVGVIGAGVSGLACAKAAIECGLAPTVFEQSSEIGGTWRSSDGLVWEGMLANLSQRSMSYSDFPWPFDTPPNPSAPQVLAYLTQYAERFGLLKFVRFRTTVRSVTRRGQKWAVGWGDGNEVSEFDFVLVATGFFSVPSYPDIPGLLESETNEPRAWACHSSIFRKPSDLRGKRVIVLGNAFSGADISVALVKAGARRVVSVVKKPLWFSHRLVPNDDGKLLPVDAFFVRPAETHAPPPGDQARRQHEVYCKWNGGDPGRFAEELRVGDTAGIAPFLSITDGYLEDVAAGRVEVKRSLLRFVGKTATFADGTTVDFDYVICATGYGLGLPFLDQHVRNSLDFIPQDRQQPLLLHKATFHPAVPNLAFVGIFRGTYFAEVELQARWACMAFSGECSHPTAEEMAAGIEWERQVRNTNPRPQFVRPKYELAEDIAKIVGVFPQADLDGKSGPMVAKWLREGPLMAAHYRLCGLHANREVALELMRRFNTGVQECSADNWPTDARVGWLESQGDRDQVPGSWTSV